MCGCVLVQGVMWRAVGGCRWLVVLDEWMSGWWVVGEGGSVLKVDGGKGRPGQAGRQGSQYTPRRGSSHHS